mmetsp:Transcript_123304/g.360022  ORF Transcript_123304/g.360022 Transcript_123304/m.360022 type:complete len:418 (-) Transcript_123304:67-1320(-)
MPMHDGTSDAADAASTAKAKGDTPTWHLEASQRTNIQEQEWCLTICLPPCCNTPPVLLEHNDREVRLGFKDAGTSVWRLCVPEYARPVSHLAEANFQRRSHRLVLRWTSVCAKQGQEVGHADFIKVEDGICNAQTDAGPEGEPSGLSSDESVVPSSSNASWCFSCGSKASACCTKCSVASYCSRRCQKAHWQEDHRARCRFVSRIATAEKQRDRGDAELAVLTLEEILRDTVTALKREADKEFTYDGLVAMALLRSFAAAVVALGAALATASMPDDKFCRAAYTAMATLLDMAATLGDARRPQVLQEHVDGIVACLEGSLSKEADPVLSAWMFYDRYARSLDERPSHFCGKLRQLKAPALVCMRDVLAASHDILEASSAEIDRRGAGQAGRHLDREELRVGTDHLEHLRPYWPGAPV